jgi:hypothetical protein
MSIWPNAIGIVAILMSISCFVLFCYDVAKAKPTAKDVADTAVQAAQNAASRGVDDAIDTPAILDPAIIGAVAKALADAFSKIGPGLVCLIGAILFLFLSGAATKVYDLKSTTPSVSSAVDPSTTGHAEAPVGNEPAPVGGSSVEG